MKIGGGTAAGTNLGNEDNNKKNAITPIYDFRSNPWAMHDST